MVRSQKSIREVVGVAVGNAPYKISDRTYLTYGAQVGISYSSFELNLSA